MSIKSPMISRRHLLAGAGAGIVITGLGPFGRPAFAMGKIRQGYQTNIWGMPTYYMMQSGILKEMGIETEEFAVPSGNLTMQQMVARQVDMGTYAGPSLLIGHDKGGLVGIAKIQNVGGTIRVMARKDLGLKKMEDLAGKKVANQTGSSVGNIFVDQLAPKYGLTKGTFQEVRMNVNDMVAALAAKTVDAMVCVEPYNAIAEAEDIGTTIVSYTDVDPLPVFMAATPDFADQHGDTIVTYLKGWLKIADDFKNNPDNVAKVIHGFYTSKGYKLNETTMKNALSGIVVDPGFPNDLGPYMTKHADSLLAAKKIKAIPDMAKVLRTEFMEKALKA